MKRPVLWHACVVLALGSLANSVSLAQSATDCSAVVEDMARLKCYDEQARQKKAAAPRPAASTPASTPSDFGLDPETVRKKQAAANPEAPQAPEQIVGLVKSVVTKPRGQYRITLEDGQVWEETQQTGGAAPKVGETVTIKRGLLGSYFLSRATGLSLRVKRID